jgi:hypothetical protein
VRIVDVDHAPLRIHHRHEPRLHTEVLFHRRVIVQMVLAQVRERRHCEAHSVDAMQVDRVRGDLHRDTRDSGIHHTLEQLLQVARLGRRA